MTTTACNANGRRGVAMMIDTRYEKHFLRTVIKGHTAIGITLQLKNNTLVIVQVYLSNITASREEMKDAYKEIDEILAEHKTGKIGKFL